MRKYLAVVSEQPDYARRFCNAAQQKEKFYFTAVPFQNVSELMNFAKDHPLSFVLADDTLLDSGMLAVIPGNPGVAALSDKAEDEQKNGYLYRYQSMEEMLRKLSGLCEDMLLSSPISNEGRIVQLTAVYSPANQALRTAFAITYAAAGKRDHRTLYLNMEEFSGLSRLLHHKGGGTLSDALYALKKGELDAAVLNSLIVRQPAIDYLPPMQYADDVKEACAQEWVKLIRRIAEISNYDELVIDLPPALSGASDVMDLCNTVFLPQGESGIEKARLEELEDYLKMPQHKKIADKVQRIKLSEDYPEMNSETEDFSEELLYGGFGIAVMREAIHDRT